MRRIDAGTGPAKFEPLTDRQLEVVGGARFVRLLPDEVRAFVCQLFSPVTVVAGDVLIREGSAADALYVVVDGSLDVVHTRTGEEIALDRIGVGGVVGEVALLEDRPRLATVRASNHGAASVLRLDHHVVAAVLEVHPEVRDAMAAGVRWARVNSAIRGHAVFSSLPVDVLVEVLDAFELVELDAGDELPDAGDGLYVVETGRVLLSADDGGTYVEVGDLGPGDLFGEGTAAGDAAVGARIQARSDSSLFRLGLGAVAHLSHDAAFVERLRARAARRSSDGPGLAGAIGGAERLKIEIDQARRDRAVAEIVESDFFSALQARAGQLRRQVRRPAEPS